MGRVRETLHDVLRQTDAVLLALCVASTLYGMVLIASATSFRGTLKYVAVQGLGLLIGLALYLFLSSIDIFELAKKWKWLLGFNVGFLLLLLTPFGQTRNGNRAWLGVNDIGKNLGVGVLKSFPVTVQPAEVVKIFFIVLLAYQLALLKDRRDLVRFENVIQPTAHTAFMVGLIVVISGDAGSALVYLFHAGGCHFHRQPGAGPGAGHRRRCGGVSCRMASEPAAGLYARPLSCSPRPQLSA